MLCFSPAPCYVDLEMKSK